MCEIICCDDCGNQIVKPDDGISTGYAYTGDDKRICYACCARRDTESMVDTGRATLYLTTTQPRFHPATHAVVERYPRVEGVGAHGYGTVANWPGTLQFSVHHRSVGVHNIAGLRYDVWFKGPEGAIWHGVTYGNDTQLCHCRRTKR